MVCFSTCSSSLLEVGEAGGGADEVVGEAGVVVGEAGGGADEVVGEDGGARWAVVRCS